MRLRFPDALPKRAARIIIPSKGGHPEARRRPLLGRCSAILTLAMNVADLMRRWFERLEPEASALEAARLMIFTRQQALPVVEGDRLVGVIAERDVFRRLLVELSGTFTGVS